MPRSGITCVYVTCLLALLVLVATRHAQALGMPNTLGSSPLKKQSRPIQFQSDRAYMAGM